MRTQTFTRSLVERVTALYPPGKLKNVAARKSL
jgi:hypothetical protein